MAFTNVEHMPKGCVYFLNKLSECSKNIVPLRSKFEDLGFVCFDISDITSYNSLSETVQELGKERGLGKNLPMMVFFYGFGCGNYLYLDSEFKETISYKTFAETFCVNRDENSGFILFTTTCLQKERHKQSKSKTSEENIGNAFHVCAKVPEDSVNQCLMTYAVLAEIEEMKTRENLEDFVFNVVFRIKELQKDIKEKGYVVDIRFYGVESHFYIEKTSDQMWGEGSVKTTLEIKRRLSTSSEEDFRDLDSVFTCCSEGNTALINATRKGQLEEVDLLLKSKANIEAAEKYVQTGLRRPTMAQSTLHDLPFCAKTKLWEKSSVLEVIGNLTIYKPDLRVTHDGNIKKLELGSPSDVKKEKVIMLLGETGSGKTTLINSLVNYLFEVQWDDPFRFKLITEPLSSNQGKGQTAHISCYTLYHQSGFKVPYNLTIIDTPGFGDVSGIQRDREIAGQIRELFTTPGFQGIDHLDAVGFVTSSSVLRLTRTQIYIFDQILRLFGNDMADNIFMLLTFCDGQKPKVLSGIAEANIPYKQYFKFNNSALYADSKSGDVEEASCCDFDAMFWQMGAKSFECFLDVLRLTESKSLTLTKDVLKEREGL